MMNLINEEAETVPVGTLLDLTAYSTAELHVIQLSAISPSQYLDSESPLIIKS